MAEQAECVHLCIAIVATTAIVVAMEVVIVVVVTKQRRRGVRTTSLKAQRHKGLYVV